MRSLPIRTMRFGPTQSAAIFFRSARRLFLFARAPIFGGRIGLGVGEQARQILFVVKFNFHRRAAFRIGGLDFESFAFFFLFIFFTRDLES